jgi:hypothetical protein
MREAGYWMPDGAMLEGVEAVKEQIGPVMGFMLRFQAPAATGGKFA